MPRGDGTGPEGKGPMTGRGAGRCGDNDIAGFAGAGRGRGRGRGFGRGRARRNRLGRGQPGRAFFGRGAGRAAEEQDREQASDS